MKSFDKFSVKNQFRFILAALVICFLILGGAAYYSTRQLFLEKSGGYARNTAEKYNYEMNYLYQKMDYIMNYIVDNPQIDILIREPFSSHTVETFSSINEFLTTFTASNIEITDIAIVSPQIHWSGLYRASTLDGFHKEIKNTTATMCLGLSDNFILLSNNLEPSLLFGHNIISATDSSAIGSIYITVSLKNTSVYLPDGGGDPAYFFLTDSTDQLHPLSPGEVVTEHVKDTVSTLLHNNDLTEGSSRLQLLDTKDYQIYYSHISNADYFIISVIDKLKLGTEFTAARLLVLPAILVLIVFLFLILYILFYSVIRPINLLYLHIKEIRGGNRRLIKAPIILNGCSEIYSLSREFSDMMKEISDLDHQLFKAMATLYETKLKKQEADISFMQSQINPHFLYNTLESIKGIAYEHHVPDIAEIATAMGKMFRYSIKDEGTVSLNQELEITAAYIRIQQLRFKDRFEVNYNIPEELRQLKVIKMLLQPVVENAVIHGFFDQQKQYTLYIGAKKQGGCLILTILDDGTGIETERLAALKLALETGSPTGGIGIMNTQSRIKLMYGEEYGMKIESSWGNGTKVDIVVPVIENLHEHII